MSIQFDRPGGGVAAFMLSFSMLLALKKNGTLADDELADIVEQSLAELKAIDAEASVQLNPQRTCPQLRRWSGPLSAESPRSPPRGWVNSVRQKSSAGRGRRPRCRPCTNNSSWTGRNCMSMRSSTTRRNSRSWSIFTRRSIGCVCCHRIKSSPRQTAHYERSWIPMPRRTRHFLESGNQSSMDSQIRCAPSPMRAMKNSGCINQQQRIFKLSRQPLTNP